MGCKLPRDGVNPPLDWLKRWTIKHLSPVSAGSPQIASSAICDLNSPEYRFRVTLPLISLLPERIIAYRSVRKNGTASYFPSVKT